MTTASDETTVSQEEPTKDGTLPIVAVAALAAAIPTVALIFIPPLQRVGVALIDATTSSGDASYDPALPLKFYTENSGTIDGMALIGVVSVLISAIVVAVVYGCFAKILFKKGNRENAIGSAYLALIVGTAGLLVSTLVTVSPHTEGAVSGREAPAWVSQWVEGRYGLDIDDATAKSLMEGARNGGDPVLVEGRLLNLTRIAQGGYVLTEDKSATELPTRN